MRCRTEDLGRLAVMLDNLMDLDVFKEERMRPKDFYDWFKEQEEEKQIDTLERFVYGIQKIEDLIHDMRHIARGEDCLNALSES